MDLQLHGKGLEITPSVQEYARKKLAFLRRIVPPEEYAALKVQLGVARTTRHHYKGCVYRISLKVQAGRGVWHAAVPAANVREGIDKAKDLLKRRIVTGKEELRARRRA
ncbi:hypothetical protein D6779_00290 [Candidatus Parcubacteria bacterium]|nr:MAG: hypothetical protein D6779_00290 [Candidatus Parcubacteria bacterium]